MRSAGILNNAIPRPDVLLGLVLLACLLAAGCASSEYLEIRKAPQNPLAGPLELLSWTGPKPSPRTAVLLRRFDLEGVMRNDPDEGLKRLQEEIEREPTPEKLYAFAELSYVFGKRKDLLGDDEGALSCYGAAVAHAYLYLFDPRFNHVRNHYDPQFRGACDVYNAGLEGALRVVNKAGLLKPGTTQMIAVGGREYAVHISVQGKWHAEEFERFEFVSDYELQGLNNRHHHFGLGVPLIAVRKERATSGPVEAYYPPGLSFPVTAFLRVSPHHSNENGAQPTKCTLELHDPMDANHIALENRIVPLETDSSTALAYFLDHPKLQQSRALATIGLINPNYAAPLSGLYMLEPYDPDRIPVIMVHGLWSSPLTWMEMFNDLRGFPEVQRNFQFWFYLYPSGQPFWVSAASLREDLATARQTLDPQRRTPSLDQIVLVGHSMGGLVSRLQTVESGDAFWRIVSDSPFEEVEATPEEREELARIFFFRPNPAIRRVITIGTPHSGSEFANDYTRWLGRKFIRLPKMLVQRNSRVVQANPDIFRDPGMLTITTSIDSLSPDSPVLPVLRDLPNARWVRQHNIVGRVEEDSFLNTLSGEGDGVVALASAHFPAAQSEVVTQASHSAVHQHPKSILEVRRILLEHLHEYRQQTPYRSRPAPLLRFTDPQWTPPLAVPQGPAPP